MYSGRVKEGEVERGNGEREGKRKIGPLLLEVFSVSYTDLHSKFFSISSMVACSECSL